MPRTTTRRRMTLSQRRVLRLINEHGSFFHFAGSENGIEFGARLRVAVLRLEELGLVLVTRRHTDTINRSETRYTVKPAPDFIAKFESLGEREDQ